MRAHRAGPVGPAPHGVRRQLQEYVTVPAGRPTAALLHVMTVPMATFGVNVNEQLAPPPYSTSSSHHWPPG